MTARTLRPLSAHERERFLASATRDHTTGCLLWNGALNTGGYGRFGVWGSTYPAHRIAWHMMHGSIPEGLELDHGCRNRRCVEASHLELVTPRVNVWRGHGFFWSVIYRDALRRIAFHPHDLVTHRTAAELLGVHRKAVERAIRSGELLETSVRRQGNGAHGYLIRKTDLIDFILTRAAEDAGATVARALIAQREHAA